MKAQLDLLYHVYAQASQLSDAVGERGAELGTKTQDTVGTVAQSATDAAIGIKDTTVEHGSKVSLKVSAT